MLLLHRSSLRGNLSRHAKCGIILNNIEHLSFFIIEFTKSLEVLDNKELQDCAAKAYLRYVEQAIEVTTQEDSAYNDFTKKAG